MNGIIIINAYSKLEHALNQSRRLREEFFRLGVDVDIRRNDFFPAYIDDDGQIKTQMIGYDFCVYLDKDKYVSLMLERAGLRLFNSHSAIEACDDKMLTHILLSNSGLKMPKTLAGLLCYDEREPISDATIDKIVSELGLPLVVKTCFGSLGKGVFKADTAAELRAICERLKCTPHLFQRFYGTGGRDIRVIVIGGQVVAAMERRSNGDFRSNLELGGSGRAVTLDEQMARACVKAANILGLDYCGIDVLCDGNDFAICEVNSNAFFGGIESVTGINVASRYASYIIGKVNEMYKDIMIGKEQADKGDLLDGPTVMAELKGTRCRTPLAEERRTK